MSNCKCGRKLKPAKDDMVKGVCVKCQSAKNRTNWKSMARFKAQGHDVRKLPDGGFQIRGQKKQEGPTVAEISEAERQKVLPRGILRPPCPDRRRGEDASEDAETE